MFSMQDAIIKSISGDHAVTLAIYLRSIVSFPILLVMVHFEVGLDKIFTPRAGWLIMRGGILFLAYLSYYIAFPALPLAEAIALFFMAPLFVTILSGPMLGERVTLWAWLAVFIGLVGVFVILQPGSGLFNPAALLSLLSAGTYGLAMVITRKLGKVESSSVISFYQNVTYLFAAPTFAGLVMLSGIKSNGHPSIDFLLRRWAFPSLNDTLFLMACGVIAAVAATLLTHAYRKGEANVVASFEYTGMIWGAFWGYMIFAEQPKLTTLIGMGLITASGVLALRAGRSNATSRDDTLA